MSKNTIAYILLIFTTLFWSGNFIVGKAASLFEIPPFTLNFYRWLCAWLILASSSIPKTLVLTGPDDGNNSLYACA